MAVERRVMGVHALESEAEARSSDSWHGVRFMARDAGLVCAEQRYVGAAQRGRDRASGACLGPSMGMAGMVRRVGSGVEIACDVVCYTTCTLI